MLAARFIAIFSIFIAMDVGSRRCMRRLDKPSLARATPCEGFPPQTWDVTVGQDATGESFGYEFQPGIGMSDVNSMIVVTDSLTSVSDGSRSTRMKVRSSANDRFVTDDDIALRAAAEMPGHRK
jgi:hypothetical protein